MNNFYKKIFVLSVMVVGGFTATHVEATSIAAPACSIQTKSGDIVVKFDNTKEIFSTGKGSLNRYGGSLYNPYTSKSANIPAGDYEVMLESFDGSTTRSQASSQPKEIYHVEFKSGNSIVAKSGNTTDLADKKRTASWKGTVNSKLTISKSINTVVAMHSAYLDNSSPNSLTPICMVLRKVASPVNGDCGTVDGNVFANRPTSGLCTVGTASAVAGSGPWTWTCVGENGGKTDNCSAQIIPAPECGSAHEGTTSARPTQNLCTVGTASAVAGSGPWTWTCTNEERTSSCNAQFADVAISIDKRNGDNTGDLQHIARGTDAHFTITVKNSGEENLTNVVVSDPHASTCNRNASQTAKLYDGDMFDPGESFTYTCVDENIAQSYVNTASVNGDATTSTRTVSDNDDSSVVVNEDPVIPSEEPEEPEEPEDDDSCDGAIGNMVWNDRNKNGVQDTGEEGISGVRLKLYNGDDVEKDTTDTRGHYKFKDLCEGSYRVVVAEETLPQGCYQTYDKDHKLDNTIKTSIDSDEYYRKADFGYYCPSSAPTVQTSPQTGPGVVAGLIALMSATGSAAYVFKRKA